MSDTHESLTGIPLGKVLRGIRVLRGMRQRDMASLVGVTPHSWGNAECSSHRTMRRDRIERLATGLKMTPDERAYLLAAFDAAPLSAFAVKRREILSKRNELRAAGRNAKALRSALVRVLEVHVTAGDSCECDLSFACELCQAMRALGVEAGWQTAELAGAALLGVLPDGEPTGSPQAVDTPDDDFGEPA